MSGRGITLVLGTVAGAFLAAGLIPLATSPVAHAIPCTGAPDCDPDFIDHTDHLGRLSDTAAADPDDHEFVANVISTPHLIDVTTSGTDPSDSLASVPGLSDIGTAGIGEAGHTVSTFIFPSDPALDFTLKLPFTDPFAEIFTFFVPLGF